MKTVLIIEIDHTRPLPSKSPIGEVLGQRVYGYLYANNCEAGVTVKDVCRFPECRCPMDPGPDENWCARGLPHVRGMA